MNPDQNYRAAQATFNGFVNFVKYGTTAAVVIAALVVLLIAK